MSKKIYNVKYHDVSWQPGYRMIRTRSFLNLQLLLVTQDYNHQIGAALDFETSGATSLKFSFRSKAFYISWWATRVRKGTQ